MRKKLFIVALATVGLAQGVSAQTNVQTFYDFGKDRQYITTTFEMFKGDEFGDTFFFIDHYYATSDQRDTKLASAINGSYFEIERGINFWQNSNLKDLSAMVEYDGSTWGQGIFCIGAKYFLHSADYSKTFTAALLYDAFIGTNEADIPIKFSGVWGLNDIFGVKGLVFKGFIDVWGLNSTFANGNTAKFSVLTEPQLWFNLGDVCKNHLDIGTEVELSYNFAGNEGFMVNPCAGLRWSF